MALQTSVHEIINKMVDIKQLSDDVSNDFNKFCDSITIDEWKDLRDFGEGLTRLADVHMKRKIRVIK